MKTIVTVLILLCVNVSLFTEEMTEPPKAIESYKVKQAYKKYKAELEKARAIKEKAESDYTDLIKAEMTAAMKDADAKKYEAFKAYLGQEETPLIADEEKQADKPNLKPKLSEKRNSIITDINQEEVYALNLKEVKGRKINLVVTCKPLNDKFASYGEIYLNGKSIYKFGEPERTKTELTIDITDQITTSDIEEYKITFAKTVKATQHLVVDKVEAKYR